MYRMQASIEAISVHELRIEKLVPIEEPCMQAVHRTQFQRKTTDGCILARQLAGHVSVIFTDVLHVCSALSDCCK